MGAISGPPCKIKAPHGLAGARRTGGEWGPCPEPPCRDRGAPRLGRGAPKRWGNGGHVGAPMSNRLRRVLLGGRLRVTVPVAARVLHHLGVGLALVGRE